VCGELNFGYLMGIVVLNAFCCVSLGMCSGELNFGYSLGIGVVVCVLNAFFG